MYSQQFVVAIIFLKNHVFVLSNFVWTFSKIQCVNYHKQMPNWLSSVGRASAWSHTERQWYAWSWTWAPPMLVYKYVDWMVCLPCWPQRGQQVSHLRGIWGIHYMQATCMQVRESIMALKPGQMSPQVQNRGISGLQKRTDVFQKLKKLITINRKVSW